MRCRLQKILRGIFSRWPLVADGEYGRGMETAASPRDRLGVVGGRERPAEAPLPPYNPTEPEESYSGQPDPGVETRYDPRIRHCDKNDKSRWMRISRGAPQKKYHQCHAETEVLSIFRLVLWY